MVKTSKPRILMICPLPPPVHGSAMMSQYIKDSKHINDEFDMDFVNLSTSRQMSEIGKGGFVLSTKKLGRFLCSLFRCLWLLLTHKYALCYCAITCHGTGFLKDSPFVLLCKLFGHKVVIHQHNKGMNNDLDDWPYRWYIPFVYKKCKVMLLSWRLYSDIERVVKKEDVMICPNGIPPIAETTGMDRPENKVPRLLFLSNLMISKGVLVLLDACKILMNQGYCFKCIFVGGESMEISRDVFDKAVQDRSLGDFVQYLGKRFGEEKMEQYRSSDIFVLPTMDDCLPLTIIEAMQLALPTVSTDTGAIADLVEHRVTGLICKANVPEDLADKLGALIKDQTLRESMGRQAFESYKERFSLEAFENCFITCMSSVIN